jgi:4a-hydroxytetrahydrobiopterin dehydratase
MTKLSESQVADKLTDLEGWSDLNGSIQRTYSFESFAAAINFVNVIAQHAEEVQHHPDILVRYSKVTLTLSTHDVSGISDKDFDFARAADGIVGE